MLRTSILLIALAVTCVAQKDDSPLNSFDIEWKCDTQKEYKVKYSVDEDFLGQVLLNEIGQDIAEYKCHTPICQTSHFFMNTVSAELKKHSFNVIVQHSCSKQGHMTTTTIPMKSGKAPTSVNICIDLTNPKKPTLKYL